MATQRVGKGSSEQKKNGDVGGAASHSSTEDSVAKKRQDRKLRALREQDQSSKMRWLLLALLLIVAMVGFYYYISYSQTPQPRTTREKTSKPRTTQGKTGKPQTKTTKSPKEKPRTGSEKVETSNPPKKTSAKKPGKKPVKKKPPKMSEHEEKLKYRVLRQPIPVSDPDRPHMMEILTADNLLIDGKYQDALDRFNAILSTFPQSARAQFGKGITLSHMAKEKRSNKLLDSAIDFFRMVGLQSITAGDSIRLPALVAMVDKAQERGKIQLAVRGMEKLVELRSNDMTFANKLGMLYLSQGNARKAKTQFKKSIDKFEDNHFGRAQLGSILYSEKQYEQALPLIMGGIRNDQDIRKSGRFYNYAGDTLKRLNRSEEALALFGEGVSMGLFPSIWQRSLVNEPGLTASPWWSPDTTNYMTEISRVEKNIDIIRSEALSTFNVEKVAFVDGSGKMTPHFVLFSNGKKNFRNCQSAPKTCALIETFPEAAGCRRGTVKFSSIPPNTHIGSHVGSTNTKLQVVVGLQLDPQGGIQIRVATDKKIIGSGQIGVIDESFEKEIWYLGQEPAVYLTIDVWHPDLSEEKQQHLSPL